MKVYSHGDRDGICGLQNPKSGHPRRQLSPSAATIPTFDVIYYITKILISSTYKRSKRAISYYTSSLTFPPSSYTVTTLLHIHLLY